MKYRIVTDSAKNVIELNGLDALIDYVHSKSWRFTGTHKAKHTRAELQGQPTVKELHGPCWAGDSIRYEDWPTCDLLSG